MTLAESLLALFLVGLVMGLLAALFQRSIQVLRFLDDKERARQAGRMGLDRISSELREATKLLSLGDSVSFIKIDPTKDVSPPPPAPSPVPSDPDNFVLPVWTPEMAYPDSARLRVRYDTSDEKLYRQVQQADGGTPTRQLIIEGINSFICRQELEFGVPKNPGEVIIEVSVRDNERVVILSSRILCPCIKEKFKL